MNKMLKDAVLITAACTAGFCAYKWMSPDDKQQISRTASKMGRDMCDVKEDMCDMAESIRDSF